MRSLQVYGNKYSQLAGAGYEEQVTKSKVSINHRIIEAKAGFYNGNEKSTIKIKW